MADYSDANFKNKSKQWLPELLLRYPNLGQPCFAKVTQGQNLKLDVTFAGRKDNLNPLTLLKGKLFLQPLDDTRQIFQDGLIKNVSHMGNLPSALKQRLIPVSAKVVLASYKSQWVWFRNRVPYTRTLKASDIQYPYAYPVQLEIAASDLSQVSTPQLFNLIHDFPKLDWYNTNFHAVYLHKKDMASFKFVHVTDPHFAWRNDEIADVIEKSLPGTKKKYINWNQYGRDLFSYANMKHAFGELDFMVLTGDIVDYVHDNNKTRTNHKVRPMDNFEFFRELVIANPSHPDIEIGSELSVPSFIVLGNHDYRLNEYPLVAKGTAAGKTWDIDQFGGFGLEKKEAIAYEGKVTTFGKEDALKFVEYCEDPPPSYRALINPDADFALPLNQSNLVFMDTRRDTGLVTGLGDYLFPSESQQDFMSGSPDSVGFSKQQAAFFKKEMNKTKAQLIACFHAPMVNIREGTPHYLCRETRRDQLNQLSKKGEFLHYLLHSHAHIDRLTDVPLDTDGKLLKAVHSVMTQQQKATLLESIRFFNLDAAGKHKLLEYMVQSILNNKQKKDLESSLNKKEFNGALVHGPLDWKVKTRLTDQQAAVRFDQLVFLTLSQSQKAQLLDYIIQTQFALLNYGFDIVRDILFHGAKANVDLKPNQFANLISYLVNNNQWNKYFDGDWSFSPTKYFKTGKRDPYLGRGAVDNEFDTILKATMDGVNNDKRIVFFTGHTHDSIEYIAKIVNSKFQYFHDYYLDNTIQGKSHKSFWLNHENYPDKTSPNYPDPLSKSSSPLAWWKKHSPLFVQTQGLKDGQAILVKVQNDVITETERITFKKAKSLPPAVKKVPCNPYFILGMSAP